VSTESTEAISSPAESALLVHCPHCWAPPGAPCTIGGVPGQHLARYQRAERRGALTRQALADVVGCLDVIASHVLVPDVAP
jgi:hypothetical protein